MTHFNALDQSLDIAKLQANGWTVAGNLAFRHAETIELVRELRQIFDEVGKQ